jgi:DUF1365 family protein
VTASTALYTAEVRHTRLTPVHYAFTQRTYYWLVDIDAMPRLPFYVRPMAVVSPRDHFGDPRSSIRQNVDRLLAARGVELPGGRVLMLCQARVLGHVFNPLTVFWCHREDDSVACVIAEVHNTYGGRHCYVFAPDARGRAVAVKQFHVSPFFPVDGEYRMRLPAPGARLHLAVDYRVGGTTCFTAALSGVRRPLNRRILLWVVVCRPASTLAISALIRLHGIRLLLLRIARHPCPDADRGRPAPEASTTRRL